MALCGLGRSKQAPRPGGRGREAGVPGAFADLAAASKGRGREALHSWPTPIKFQVQMFQPGGCKFQASGITQCASIQRLMVQIRWYSRFIRQ